jgi:hypothetical protein
MRQNFRLIREPVGNNLKNQYNDVLRVKSALSGLGLFEEENMHGYVTREMDSSLKNLQRESRLQIDGRLFPDGETETEILRRLVDSGGRVPSVEKGEELAPLPRQPWPTIPGTNIPDFSMPDHGFPPRQNFDPYGIFRRQYSQDPEIIKRKIHPNTYDRFMEKFDDGSSIRIPTEWDI